MDELKSEQFKLLCKAAELSHVSEKSRSVVTATKTDRTLRVIEKCAD